jgi:hypothetical protein
MLKFTVASRFVSLLLQIVEISDITRRFANTVLFDRYANLRLDRKQGISGIKDTDNPIVLTRRYPNITPRVPDARKNLRKKSQKH